MSSLCLKTDGKLVAVAEAVEIVVGFIHKAAARVILSGLISVGRVKRMNIAQAVTTGVNVESVVDACYPHVGERVVITDDDDTDTVVCFITDNVYIVDVTVGGSVVRTPVDLDTYLDIFDRGVTDDCFTAAVNRNTGRYTIPINNAAGKDPSLRGGSSLPRETSRLQP